MLYIYIVFLQSVLNIVLLGIVVILQVSVFHNVDIATDKDLKPIYVLTRGILNRRPDYIACIL